MQPNRLTRLIETATQITIESATLIDHVIHIQFLENTDCGILETGLTDHCITFVKLPFSCKNYDDG